MRKANQLVPFITGFGCKINQDIYRKIDCLLATFPLWEKNGRAAASEKNHDFAIKNLILP